MKKPHSTLVQLATTVVNSLITLSKSSPIQFERDSAVRFACDFMLLLVGPTPPPCGDRYKVWDPDIQGPGVPAPLQFATRRDMDAFARLAHAASLTSDWAQRSDYSWFRVTDRLRWEFMSAILNWVGELPDATLLALATQASGGSLRKPVAGRIAGALEGYGHGRRRYGEFDTVVSLMFDVIAAMLAGGNADSQRQLVFFHTAGTPVQVVLSDGSSHRAACSVQALQLFVATASYSGNLSLIAMTPTVTSVVLATEPLGYVRRAIAEAVGANQLLAEHLKGSTLVPSGKGPPKHPRAFVPGTAPLLAGTPDLKAR